jgi:pimeloyl-ACP methyl ester carboxylesterase
MTPMTVLGPRAGDPRVVSVGWDQTRRQTRRTEASVTRAERLIDAHGVNLCTESFGHPADPPILLVMGLGASMLWWQEGFCRMLADTGRFVIRYDHRDTGRSVTYQPGRPGYTGADLVADAAAVLDGYRIPAAHVVGVSAGGAFAQLFALDHSDHVLSLVLISTSPATPGDRRLPPPTERFTRFVTTTQLDRSDTGSAIDYLVGYSRMLAGGQRLFDEAPVRELVCRRCARRIPAREHRGQLSGGACQVAVASVPARTARTSPTVRSRVVGSGSGRCAWIWYLLRRPSFCLTTYPASVRSVRMP